MKRTFVQCAEIVLEPGGDRAAPGGAVTRLLCGSWDHPGPCRWPHLTSATWDENRAEVRVVFLASEDEETGVRASIDQALVGGECIGPEGQLSRWTTMKQHAGVLTESEQDWGKVAAQPPGSPLH